MALARPAHDDLVDVFLSRPSAVVLEGPTGGQFELISDRFDRSGVFDPLATWVAVLCRERG